MTKNENVNKIVNELKHVHLELEVEVYTFSDLQKMLAEHINYLITNNFSRLIFILYRLDISEKKLKQFLMNKTNTAAGDIIAKMIIERQLQKFEARKSFRGNNLFSDEEKW